jgi:3-oxosteroid 1-dehydrogenase
MTWDHTFDVVVIGSGAAGLSAALRAHDLGATTLVLEASDRYGGSTAISGGVVWIPNNPQLPSRGISDSREDALTYLCGITRGRVSQDRIEAYVDRSLQVYDWLHSQTHVRLDALEDYCDYYPEAPGGKPGGRSMEPVPFDATRLGSEFRTLQRPHPQSQIMGLFGITAREAKGYLVPGIRGRLKLLWRFVQYALRWPKRRGQPRDTKLYAGNALIGRLRLSLLDRDMPLWLTSPVREVLYEEGRAVGVVVERDGKREQIRAIQGVVLGAGGFEQNQAMRAKYQGQRVRTDWNAGHERNQGDAIRWGIAAGAAVDLMEHAWWTPVTRVPRSKKAWVLVVEKSLPGSLFVNKHAQRFTNEAGPYLDVGRAMYEGDAVPVCWMIFDGLFRHNYPVGPTAPGYAVPDKRLPRKLREDFFVKAATLEKLAEKTDLDPTALTETVAHYNALCAAGEDTDYGRGQSASDRYYGDGRWTDNPCLRPLDKPPYYAIRIYPGDLGTKGGLVTDAKARVLRPDGTAIPGLYAAGNTSASVMGETYPGAGGTIGPALVFGYCAGEAAVNDATG